MFLLLLSSRRDLLLFLSLRVLCTIGYRATEVNADGTRLSSDRQRIAELGDWRGEMLATVRGIILAADPEIVEEWKWRGVPVWSRGGIVCTGETYKAVVKLTFAKGAALADPPASSTRASTATCGARSICTKAKLRTKRLCGS